MSGAVEDYPRTLAEFESRFAMPEACRAYLEQLRWPGGFRCPKCGGAKAWRRRTGLLQAVAVDPAPYASLVKHVRSGKRRPRRHKI